MHIPSAFCSHEWIAGGIEDDKARLIGLCRLGQEVEILSAVFTK